MTAHQARYLAGKAKFALQYPRTHHPGGDGDVKTTKTLLTAVALAATAMAGAFGTLGTASAAPVTLTFEGVAPENGASFAPTGGVLYTQDGFVATATGTVGGQLIDSGFGDATGSDYASLLGGQLFPNVRGFAIEADDGSAFDLISFQAAGSFGDTSISFRIDFERADGATGSTEVFLLRSGTTSPVPLQTLTVNLTGIVRAVFVSPDVALTRSSEIAIDNVVLNSDAAAVPLPAAALLFPLGLGGLAAARRRRG